MTSIIPCNAMLAAGITSTILTIYFLGKLRQLNKEWYEHCNQLNEDWANFCEPRDRAIEAIKFMEDPEQVEYGPEECGRHK